jgi:mannosyltransferase
VNDVRVIAACLGRRYSGINASMRAVIPEQLKHESIAVLGWKVPEGLPRITWRQVLKSRRRQRIWHARRNTDMVVGILLRALGWKFKLVFTSAALRKKTWTTRLLLNRMDAIIATTAKAASFLDVPATVVMHGVDLERFHPDPDERENLIGIFGRIRENKGSGDFAQALAKVLPTAAHWRAVFVGEPESETFRRHLLQSLKQARIADRISFTGFVPTADIAGWYRKMKVVVCASRKEGFGLPCLEAMASGCAVVATRAGAWPEIVQDGVTGILVDSGSPSALATAIQSVLTRTEEMGKQGRALVESRFGIAGEARGIQAVYDSLIGPR